MIVFHCTTKEVALAFLAKGIDAHLPITRSRHHPLTEGRPGIFVSPTIEAAQAAGMGRSVLSIDVDPSSLQVPYHMAAMGITLEESWNNPCEPQAIIVKRIEPEQIKLAQHEEPRGSRLHNCSSEPQIQ